MTAPARRTAPRRSPLRTPPIIEVEEEEEAAMLNQAPPMEIAPRRVRRRMPAVWKIIAWGFGLIIGLPIAIAIVIGSVEGIAGSASSAPAVVHTGDAYRDCLTLAQTDSYAPEVCEPLNPDSKVAKAAMNTDASTVAAFNDGFGTSKQDDCDQGFAKACDWLKGK